MALGQTSMGPKTHPPRYGQRSSCPRHAACAVRPCVSVRTSCKSRSNFCNRYISLAELAFYPLRSCLYAHALAFQRRKEVLQSGGNNTCLLCWEICKLFCGVLAILSLRCSETETKIGWRVFRFERAQRIVAVCGTTPSPCVVARLYSLVLG
jgi:hypothetical protein